jgi:hypothetical protein
MRRTSGMRCRFECRGRLASVDTAVFAGARLIDLDLNE